jgi:indolepyruvate ferredoxin oxidoreductase beta subunit
MAQRGGQVNSMIRLGSEVYGPIISPGKCNVLVGLEFAEALRSIAYLSKSSLGIINSKKIIPYTVSLGLGSYPGEKQILEKLRGVAEKVVVVDADQLAKESGSPLSANIVMLGALFGTRRLPLKVETIKEMIEQTFPKQAGANIRAFDSGYKACQQALANPQK